MAKLSDVFPDELKRLHITSSMNPGAMLLLFCSFTTPPKEKFLALAFLHLARKPLMLIINSQIPTFVARRPLLLDSQVRIHPADYGFLTHDSYIDCSKVIDHFEYDHVETQLIADLSRLKGILTQTTKEQVVAAVWQARTVSMEHKRLISDALTPV